MKEFERVQHKEPALQYLKEYDTFKNVGTNISTQMMTQCLIHYFFNVTKYICHRQK
jgi:hypothetical protein